MAHAVQAVRVFARLPEEEIVRSCLARSCLANRLSPAGDLETGAGPGEASKSSGRIAIQVALLMLQASIRNKSSLLRARLQSNIAERRATCPGNSSCAATVIVVFTGAAGYVQPALSRRALISPLTSNKTMPGSALTRAPPVYRRQRLLPGPWMLTVAPSWITTPTEPSALRSILAPIRNLVVD